MKYGTLQIRTRTLKILVCCNVIVVIVIRYLDDERESADDERCQRNGLRETARTTA